jgi:hypothetical protein
MMSATRFAVLAVVAAACLLAPAEAGAAPPQLNYEASAVASLRTADPCVVTEIQADVLDFLPAGQPTQVAVGGGTFNQCSGEWVQLVGALDPIYTESGFTINKGGESADLNISFEGFEFVLAQATRVSATLHWEGVASTPTDGAAAVTGSIISDSGFTAILDDSIAWNRWGSALGYPWAGLWRCVFTVGRGSPGCIGQTSNVRRTSWAR